MGAATTRHDYNAYGKPLTTSGSTAINGRAYINERYDAESGLQYLNAQRIMVTDQESSEATKSKGQPTSSQHEFEGASSEC
jgi:hypothetical protein